MSITARIVQSITFCQSATVRILLLECDQVAAAASRCSCAPSFCSSSPRSGGADAPFGNDRQSALVHLRHQLSVPVGGIEIGRRRVSRSTPASRSRYNTTAMGSPQSPR